MHKEPEGEKVPVLDHGCVQLIDSWGNDERVIEAARMSTGKGFLGWGPSHSDDCSSFQGLKLDSSCGCTDKPGDEKLLKYLWDNKHHTPFEMAGMTIEVQAPIMVFREWHRHRVPFGYNEMSARYTPLPDVNYVPTVDRLLVGSDGKNRQAGTIKDAEVLDEAGAAEYRDELRAMWDMQEKMYQKWLRRGVPKELARLHLGVGRYSRMRATSNLRGWLGFLKLRAAPQAQFEIRKFADEVGVLLAKLFPRTWQLFVGEG